MTGPVDFVETLQLQFMAPEAAARDPDGFLKLYTDALREFTPKVLEEVLADLVQYQVSGSFPSVRDCVGRCREKRAALAPKKVRKGTSWAGEGVELANRLVRGDLGRQAAEGGWIIGLWDFCRTKGRWPNGMEVDHIKEATAIADARAAELGQGTIARNFREAHSKKKQRLTAMVLGELVSNGSSGSSSAQG